MELKKCKKLGRSATKQQLRDTHKIKMGVKAELRANAYQRFSPSEYVFANISKNHEYWGDTPREHEARKHTL